MSLKQEIKRGVFYTFIFRYLGIALQVVSTSIMARLLTPAEFGIMVAIMVFVSFFQLISESGLAVAIIQKKDLNDLDIFSLFIFTIVWGIVISSLFILSGPIIADFYNNQEYIKISKILSLSLFFYCLQVIPHSILFRDKKFKILGKINVIVLLVSYSFSIFLALNGFGFYSLVYQSISMSIIKFLLVIYYSPIVLFRKFNFNALKKIFNYSIFKLFSDILRYFSINMDNILIGKYLGVVPLGYYDKAYKLMVLPVGNLVDVVTPVLHPVLSNYQDDKVLIYNFLKKFTRIVATIGVPLTIFLFFSAQEIILILFGNQWVGSIQAFRYLSLAIWAQMILSTSNSIYLSLGRSDFLFFTGFISSITILTAIIMGIFLEGSIEAIALFLSIAYLINLIQVYFFLITKVIKKNLLDFFSTLIPGFYIGFIILIINLLLGSTLVINNIILSLFIKIICSGAAFILLLYISKEINLIKEIIRS